MGPPASGLVVFRRRAERVKTQGNEPCSERWCLVRQRVCLVIGLAAERCITGASFRLSSGRSGAGEPAAHKPASSGRFTLQRTCVTFAPSGCLPVLHTGVACWVTGAPAQTDLDAESPVLSLRT